MTPVEELHRSAVIDSDYFVDSGKATAYRVGFVDITISSPTGAPVLINSITPVIYESDSTEPSWALRDESGDCGGFTLRLLQAYLLEDEPTIWDRGVNDAGITVDTVVGALGDTFVVTEAEPVVVQLEVHACKARNYAFGFDIVYTLHGSKHHHSIGTEEKPYRIIGVPTENLWLASGEPGPGQISVGEEANFEAPEC